MTVADRSVYCWVRSFARLMALACWVLVAPTAWSAANDCGSLRRDDGGTGPYDYRNGGILLADVNKFHFPPSVEALIRSQFDKEGVGGELSYTFLVFPNHHRALMTLVRYVEKIKANPLGFKWQGVLQYSPDCYFVRAIRFRSDDLVVRMIYARFLYLNGRAGEAEGQLKFVEESKAADWHTNYTLGLIYLEFNNVDKALERARMAYAAGHPPPALREQLTRMGKWLPGDVGAQGPGNQTQSIPSTQERAGSEGNPPSVID